MKKSLLLLALLIVAVGARATVSICDVQPDKNGHHATPGSDRLATHIMTSRGGNIKGDVNGDNEVNIADVNAVIKVILDGDSNPRADVNNDTEVNIADVNAVINIILNPAPADVHEWVDLGLPSGTLWATCNVGANVPEQYGDYFAWGETTPKEYYDFSTYKWCNGTWNTLTKYCSDSYWGTVDNKRELDSEDDDASVNWGSSWRMPSAIQMKELCRSCTWQWTQRNGVNGQQVTGPNGNTLFLPVAGLRGEGSLLQAGSCGFYWSRTVDTADPDGACCLFFDSNGMDDTGSGNRVAGFSVRAVRVLFH